MMILVLSRNQQSYFQSYKNYFVAIFLAFLVWPAADLVFIAGSPVALMTLAIQGIVTSGVLIALIWGYVATKLYLYPDSLSIKRLFTLPTRPIFLIYFLYSFPMVLALIANWADPSLISVSQVAYPFEGLERSVATLGSLLLTMGAVVVVAFTLYPLAAITRRRALVKDKDVRKALLTIAIMFSAISVTLILAIGLLSFGYSIVGSADFLSVIMIAIVSQAFRRPTFLKSFLGVVPSLESSPNAAHYDQMILIHGPGNEKFAPIAKYIIEGVGQRERMIYFHNGDVGPVTDGLSREGVDVTRMMLKGSLRISPLGSIYPKQGVIENTPLEAIQELAQEAKTLGNDGLRVVLDYDDFTVRPMEKFVQHLTDPGWTSPDHRLHVLMIFDSAAFRGEEGSLARLERQVRTLDLAETRDTFSTAVGLSRDDIVGRKMLFEYDPQVEYERVFKSLLAENAANIERTVVFTRRESPLYSLARRQPGTKIFVFTSRVSFPKMEDENLFLLPTYDTSLALDAINKTIDAYAVSSFSIVFDNISHFVFTVGPERTYSLVRQALELMVSNQITAIFAINSEAHDRKVVSTFENMFDIELLWEQGSRNPVVRKKQMVVD
jgi:hypothetical protein